MKKIDISFLLVLLSGLISMEVQAQSVFPRYLGYSLVLISYIVLSMVIFTDREMEITSSARITWFFSPIIIIFMIHYLQSLSPTIIVRTITFIVFFMLNVLILPNIISKISFTYLVSRLGFSIVLFLSPIHIINILNTQNTPEIYFWPILFAMSSNPGVPALDYIGNPNYLAIILFIALMSSLYIYQLRNTKTEIIILLIIFIGLFLTQSRGAIIATSFSLSSLIIYRYFGQPYYSYSIIMSVIGSLSLYFILIGLIPVTKITDFIHLSARDKLLWSSVNALKHNPFGFGAIPTSDILLEPYAVSDVAGTSAHNSFLRVFLTTGIVGGTCYLLFNIYSLIRLKSINDHPYIVSICLGLFVAQIFNEFTMFGIGLTSILTAVCFGYLYTNPANATPESGSS